MGEVGLKFKIETIKTADNCMVIDDRKCSRPNVTLKSVIARKVSLRKLSPKNQFYG